MSFPAPYIRSLRIAAVAGGVVAAVGLAVLGGWMTGMERLTQVRSHWTPMVPMTAVGFCLAGAALLALTAAKAREGEARLPGKRMAMTLGVAVAVIGGRRMFYYFCEWPTTWDMLGFRPHVGPGQMAAMTAFGFLLSGAALTLTAARRFYPVAQWIAGLVAFIGWIGMTRYFYGGQTEGLFFLMAMHTALAFAVLGMGIFYARPDAGFIVIWNSDTAGGVLVRRLFPAALVVPVVVGWLRLQGERAGWYGLETGLTIFALSNVLIFALLAWSTASRLHREDLRRREAERTMTMEKNFSDAVIDSLPGAFYLYDRDGRFLRWNKNFERVTGYSAAEIAGMHPLDFFAGDDKALIAGRIGRVFTEGKAEAEAGFLAKDGTSTPYFFTGMTIALNGRDCLVGVGIDITERCRAEQAVRELNIGLEQRVARRTAELEAKNRELETFTYSVSHDLKAPLRGIDGYSRLLLEDHADRLDEEGKRFLGSVRQASAHMGQLIDDLLAYSRLDRRPAHPARVNPRELVRALLAPLAAEIETRGVRVTDTVPEGIALRADLNGLTMALRNLIDNALKFTRASKPPEIEIGARVGETACVLWVRDNGIGFDPRFLDRIFEIFQRLHRAEDYPGTGIGLAIVRKAMERMGGRAWAESEPGRGAVFYLEIPLFQP